MSRPRSSAVTLHSGFCEWLSLPVGSFPSSKSQPRLQAPEGTTDTKDTKGTCHVMQFASIDKVQYLVALAYTNQTNT